MGENQHFYQSTARERRRRRAEKILQQVLNVGASTWEPEIRRKAPLSCNAAFSMLHCSFSLAAAQLLVKMTSTLQKSQCCSATSAAQHSENRGATSVFACGMLQGWGLEGWGLGLAEETDVQKGVFGESVSSLPPSGLCPYNI